MSDVVLLVIWAVTFTTGLWLLKVTGAGGRRRRRTPLPTSMRILQVVGWIAMAVGGIGLALTFGNLFNRGVPSPGERFGL